jgi:transcription factor C subunit 6
VHKIYQLDYNRSSKEFRMLERFLPQETLDKPATAKAKAKPDAGSSELAASVPPATGVWPPSIGVHRVVWNNGNGLSGASLLGSATASGICRVDWLEGRWLKDNIPYRSIEAVRGELEGTEDMEGGEEDDLEEQE